jgi:2-iminobutanoate/2-iminopropanoate deaminase
MADRLGGRVPATGAIALAAGALIWTAAAADARAAEAAGTARSFVMPDGYDPAASPPFSNGVLAGDTFYVAGHIGLDPATGKAATDVETEVRLLMDAIKRTLAKGGLGMEDLVSVTIYCTDLSLYDRFNAVYRGYFTGKFPARAFIGVNSLVRNARFELAGVAVSSKHAPARGKK